MNRAFGIAPNFIVRDVVASAAFYRDKLGFRFEDFWGEPPSFVMVQGWGATLMLKCRPGIAGGYSNQKVHEDLGWDAYICVPDVEAVYREMKARGTPIFREMEDAPYGLRDFEVEDLDGYLLCFGEYLGE